jgi:hypothetical protein
MLKPFFSHSLYNLIAFAEPTLSSTIGSVASFDLFSLR